MIRSIYRAIGPLFLLFLMVVMVVFACTRNHDNPLDPAESDPFDLRMDGLVGRIRLAWNIPGVDNLEQTIIYRQDTSADSTFFAELTRVAVPETAYVDRDVVPEIRYEYQVSVARNGEESRKSKIQSAVPASVSSPFSLVVADHPADQGRCLDVSWALSPMDTTGGEVTGYVVMRDTLLDGAYAPVDTTQAGAKKYTDCSLAPAVLYYYRVSAMAAGILSPPTGTVSGRPVDNLPPRPPTDLRASDYPADQGSAIEVVWALSPDDGAGADDVVKYQILRSVDADTSNFYTRGSASAGETLYVDQGLDPGSVFYYRVRAEDSKNYSAYSGADSAMAVDNGAPGAPSDLLVSNPTPDGGGKIRLLWQKSPDDNGGGGLEGYKVYRRTEEGSYNDPLTTLPAGSSEHIDSTVTDLVNYYYVVTAYDGSLESTPCNEAGPVAADDELPPRAVIDLQAVPGSVEAEVNLTWTAPGDDGGSGRATMYYIKYAATEINTTGAWNSAYSITENVPTPAMAETDESMVATGMPTDWENIWFCLRAEDDRGLVSPLSNSPSTVPQEDVTPPGMINNLETSSEGALEGQVLLRWTTTGDDGDEGTADHYVVKADTNRIQNESEFDAAPELPNPPAPEPAGQTQTMMASNLVPGKYYYFRLRVFDEAHNPSPLSNEEFGLVQIDVTPPAEIDDLKATGDDAQLIEGEILLTWDAVGDDADSGAAATEHILKYHAGSDVTEGNWESCTEYLIPFPPGLPDEQQSLKVTGFDPETLYYFGIKVFDDHDLPSGVSNSPGSYPQTDVTPPAAILTLQASGNAPELIEGQIMLTWMAVADDSLTQGGPVSDYEFRYSATPFPIDDGNWGSATVLDNDHIHRGPGFSAPGLQDTLIAKNLNPGERLHFACKAADEHPNWSVVSNSPSDTVQTDVTPPSAVITLEAFTGSWQGELKVKWIAVPDDSNFVESGKAAKYDLRYTMVGPIDTEAKWNAATAVPSEYLPPPSEPEQPDSVTLTNLAFKKMYYLALKVADSDDNWSGLSNPANALSGADTYPPDDVTEFDIEEGDEVLHLSWTPPPHDYSWEYLGVLIARDTLSIITNPVPGGDYGVGDVLPYSPPRYPEVVYMDTMETSWDDEPLDNGITYYYRVYSFDYSLNYSEGDLPAQGSGTPADTIAPPPVSHFSAKQIEGGIRLNWQNPDPAEEDLEVVMIRYSTTAFPADTTEGTLVVVKNVEPGVADSVDHMGPPEGNLYYSAFAGDEVRNYSDPTTVLAEYDITAPPPVSLFLAKQVEGGIRLNWQNPDPAEEDLEVVMIRYSTTAFPAEITEGVLVTIKDVEQGVADSVDHLGPPEGNLYYSAFAGDEVPNYSDPTTVLAEYDITAPGQIANLTLTAGTDSITLTWDDPGDADLSGIIVLRRMGDEVTEFPEDGVDYEGESMIGTTSTIAGIVSPGVQILYDIDLEGGETYYYSLHTFDPPFNYSEGITGSEVPREP